MISRLLVSVLKQTSFEPLMNFIIEHVSEFPYKSIEANTLRDSRTIMF